jgi:hypothetical protein
LRPDPERAIRFAFIIVGLALRELILFERTRIFEDILPLNDDILARNCRECFSGIWARNPAQFRKIGQFCLTRTDSLLGLPFFLQLFQSDYGEFP